MCLILYNTSTPHATGHVINGPHYCTSVFLADLIIKLLNSLRSQTIIKLRSISIWFYSATHACSGMRLSNLSGHATLARLLYTHATVLHKSISGLRLLREIFS